MIVEDFSHFFLCFSAPEKTVSVISNVEIPKDKEQLNTSSSVTKVCQSPISPGPSRINRVLTPVNQVTPLYKRYLDSAGTFLIVLKLYRAILRFFKDMYEGHMIST